MIPKIIHYCWFGQKPLPKLGKQCLDSWKKYCPDFQIKEWNEENSPIEKFPFAQKAMEEGKWAFISDVMRLYALYTEGGIYLDTDLEIIKPLDSFLIHKAFIGYEKESNKLQTAIIGAEPESQFISDWLAIYNQTSFSSDRKIMAQLVNNRVVSRMLISKQIPLDGKMLNSDYVTIYPSPYFCPMSHGSAIELTQETVCIHYYSFSWSEPETLKGHVKKIIVNIIGEKEFRLIVNKTRSILNIKHT